MLYQRRQQESLEVQAQEMAEVTADFTRRNMTQRLRGYDLPSYPKAPTWLRIPIFEQSASSRTERPPAKQKILRFGPRTGVKWGVQEP